jgi:hypothetical protein
MTRAPGSSERKATRRRDRDAALAQEPGAGTSRRKARRRRAGDQNTILNAIALLVGFNLLAIFVGILTDWWGSFRQGWPAELLLIGLLLSAVMDATGSIWLLIPAGILLGNGILFSFYAITGAWRLWIFLWPLEPLLIGAVIYATIRLAGEEEQAAEAARRFPQVVKRPAITLALLVALVGLIVGS